MCHAQGVERTKLGFIVGRIERERPVHASRARLWETIQSTEPLRWTTAKDVLGFRTETKAVTGLAEETYPTHIVSYSSSHHQSIENSQNGPFGREMVCRRELFGRALERSMSKPPVRKDRLSIDRSRQSILATAYIVCLPTQAN